jgi:ferredoxin
VKILADRERCEGHGLCADTAPEVYDLDDDAIVVLRHEVVPPELERKAEAGARVCPVAALRIERSSVEA